MAFKLNEGKTEVNILKANVGMPLERNYPVFRCDFYHKAPRGRQRSSLLEAPNENRPPFRRWHRYIVGLILRFNTCLKAFNRQAEWPVMAKLFFLYDSRLEQAGRGPLMD